MTTVDAALLADFAQVGATLIAALAVPLAVRQLRMQAGSSRLEVMAVVDERWARRSTKPGERLLRLGVPAQEGDERTPDPLRVLDESTLSVIRETLNQHGAVPAARPPDLDEVVPSLLLLLTPQYDPPDVPHPLPTSEEQYTTNLLHRSRAVFEIMNRLDRPGGNQLVKRDLRRVLAVVEGYVNAVNDIAELMELEVADSVDLLRKRHFALMREVHLVEPFILWKNAVSETGRWGMRVLALGASARAFHWSSPLHQRKDVYLVLASDDRPYLHREYGAVVAASASPSRVPSLIQRQLRRRRVKRVFSDKSKLNQESLVKSSQTIQRAVGVRESRGKP